MRMLCRVLRNVLAIACVPMFCWPADAAESIDQACRDKGLPIGASIQTTDRTESEDKGFTVNTILSRHGPLSIQRKMSTIVDVKQKSTMVDIPPMTITTLRVVYYFFDVGELGDYLSHNDANRLSAEIIDMISGKPVDDLLMRDLLEQVESKYPDLVAAIHKLRTDAAPNRSSVFDGPGGRRKARLLGRKTLQGIPDADGQTESMIVEISNVHVWNAQGSDIGSWRGRMWYSLEHCMVVRREHGSVDGKGEAVVTAFSLPRDEQTASAYPETPEALIKALNEAHRWFDGQLMAQLTHPDSLANFKKAFLASWRQAAQKNPLTTIVPDTNIVSYYEVFGYGLSLSEVEPMTPSELYQGLVGRWAFSPQVAGTILTSRTKLLTMVSEDEGSAIAVFKIMRGKSLNHTEAFKIRRTPGGGWAADANDFLRKVIFDLPSVKFE